MGCSGSRFVASRPPTYSEWNTPGRPAYSDYSIESAVKSTGGESKSDTPGRFWTSNVQDEKVVLYSKEGSASEAVNPAMTIPQVMTLAAERSGSRAFLRKEGVSPSLGPGERPPASKPVEQWECQWTFQETFEECKQAALGFMSLGLEPFDAVTIYGFNSPEWVMGQLSCTLAGGITAGIYPSDTETQLAFKARHSGAVVALVSTVQKALMFLKLKSEGKLPKLNAIVVWNRAEKSELKEAQTSSGVKDVNLFSWTELCELGAIAGDSEREALQKRMDDQKPGNCCAYIYTSGTTGNPKAVMISHDNILYESRVAVSLIAGFGDTSSGERILSYLPLSHVAGMMVDIVCPLTVAATKPGFATLHFARPYDLKKGTLGDRLRAVRPTLFLGVPRVWEKIQEKIMAMKAADPPTGLKLKLIQWAKGLGLEHQQNCQLGGSGEYGPGYGIADSLVLSAVKKKLGLDACHFCFTGAAPIKRETLEFYGALGIQINEAYGMSECTGAATWSTVAAHIWGSCGWSMNGCEVTIRDPETNEECKAGTEGELCYRGRNIMMGYMANPELGEGHIAEIAEKNRSAIDAEGWLHSGDKGKMDDLGMFTITGRYKELIIGAGGENVAPVPVEDGVKSRCAAISNIMMVGDKRKYNVAIVTLKTKGATGELPGEDYLDPTAVALAGGATKVSEVINGENSTLVKLVEQAIRETNADTSCCPMPPSTIKKFTILPTDFSVVGDELTPTFKLKRSVTEAKWKSAIDAMYKSKDVYVPFSVLE